MRKTIWHIVRAALMFFWLFIYAKDNQHISVALACVLVFCSLYDITLACASVLKIRNIIRIQQTLITLLFATVILLILLEQSPWDDIMGYAPLWLYFFGAIFGIKSRLPKLVLLSSVLIISSVVVFFSLYRLHRIFPYLSAYVNDEHVSCHLIRLPHSRDIIIVEKNNWLLVSHNKTMLEGIMSYRSILFDNWALVDVRSSDGGIVISENNPKVGYNPKLLYKNKRLSFYIEPNKLFLCNGIEL